MSKLPMRAGYVTNGTSIDGDLAATIERCFAHVERIELDSRMTVREYRQWQERGYSDPLSAEAQELYRMKKIAEAA